MASTTVNPPAVSLPENYFSIPIDVGQSAAAMQICAVVAMQPDPVTGHLVLLRDGMDARVYLGCLMDRSGRVDRWLEIWVQSIDGLEKSPRAARESLTNSGLDQRWAADSAVMQQLPMSGSISTGWESAHPLPVFLDRKEKKPVNPIEPTSGKPWELCRDEAILSARKLNGYAGSLHRYLYVPALGEKSPMLAATAQTPAGEDVKTLAEVAGKNEDWVWLNPAGGLLRVREFSPIDVPGFLGLMAGKELAGVGMGRSRPKLPRSDPAQLAGAQWNQNAWLLIGQHGRRGRLIETFHVKLRLLADAVDSVSRFVTATKRPILTLSENSFQVRMAAAGVGLPAMWTARTELIDPGEIVQLNVESTDTRRYLPAGAGRSSVYSPAAAIGVASGRCDICVRKIIPESDGAIMVEGSFSTQERVGELGKSDLAWFRLAAPVARTELYTRLEPALAKGEWRFRSVPQRLDEETVKRLHGAEGVVLRNIEFEILPMLSTPCDLHSLACLAVRVLLTNDRRPLPETLDEIMSLARQVAKSPGAAETLPARIGAVLAEDKRWGAALGPQWLVEEEVPASEALDLVPSELWLDTLATIVKMFPGVGPDSTCKDLGDAVTQAPQRVFEAAMEDFARLVMKTRSLILIDWRYNREIHAVIRGYMMGAAAPVAKTSKG